MEGEPTRLKLDHHRSPLAAGFTSGGFSCLCSTAINTSKLGKSPDCSDIHHLDSQECFQKIGFYYDPQSNTHFCQSVSSEGRLLVELMRTRSVGGLALRRLADASAHLTRRADFSRIRNADLGRFTVDRLMSIISRLGSRIEVKIRVRGAEPV
jgi:Helix-turn-helix domain